MYQLSCSNLLRWYWCYCVHLRFWKSCPAWLWQQRSSNSSLPCAWHHYQQSLPYLPV